MLKNTRCLMIAVCLLAATFLTACLTVYKTDIQQGNLVTQEMVEKLKIGMNRNQVRFVLGTPLLTDPFHGDRWDYFYSLKKGSEQAAQIRRVTVFFDKDQLVEVEDDLKATGLNETAGPDSREVGKSENPEPAGNLNVAPHPSSG